MRSASYVLELKQEDMVCDSVLQKELMKKLRRLRLHLEIIGTPGTRKVALLQRKIYATILHSADLLVIESKLRRNDQYVFQIQMGDLMKMLRAQEAEQETEKQ